MLFHHIFHCPEQIIAFLFKLHNIQSIHLRHTSLTANQCSWAIFVEVYRSIRVFDMVTEYLAEVVAAEGKVCTSSIEVSSLSGHRFLFKTLETMLWAVDDHGLELTVFWMVSPTEVPVRVTGNVTTFSKAKLVLPTHSSIFLIYARRSSTM
jgi:hypothetical protein